MIALLRREETAEQMLVRIRAEIKAENEKNLSDPSLYLNGTKLLDGNLDELERDQIGA